MAQKRVSIRKVVTEKWSPWENVKLNKQRKKVTVIQGNRLCALFSSSSKFKGVLSSAGGLRIPAERCLLDHTICMKLKNEALLSFISFYCSCFRVNRSE